MGMTLISHRLIIEVEPVITCRASSTILDWPVVFVYYHDWCFCHHCAVAAVKCSKSRKTFWEKKQSGSEAKRSQGKRYPLSIGTSTEAKLWASGINFLHGRCKIKEEKQLLGYFLSLQNEVELGELLLSLNYLPSAGRLNVDVIRAKQLLQTDVSQGSGAVWLPPFLPISSTGRLSFLFSFSHKGPDFLFFCILDTVNKIRPALAGWLSWLECCPVLQQVSGAIPCQGTHRGRGFNIWLGCGWEATSQRISLTSMLLFLSLPLSLTSITISSGKD